jgi:outer membrane protein OmpA-like peptidoglycan-associated protein
MRKFNKAAIAVLIASVMGLSLFTTSAANASAGELSMSLTLPTNWHFGDPEQEVTYAGYGELISEDDVVEYGFEITYPGTCGAMYGDDPFYAGTYTVIPYAEVTVDGVTEELTNGESFEGYTFSAPSEEFEIYPFDVAVTINSGDSFTLYEGQLINPSMYSVASLPYGNVVTSVTFLYSGGGLDGLVTDQPTRAGTYTITPQAHFSPDADCNFNTTGTGRLVVIERPTSAVYNPDPTPTPTPTTTPVVTALKKATISVTGGTYSYDGSPKSATVTTDPAGLSVSVKYAGGSSAPMNSGNHSVIATITDKNYEATSANGTIIINKINPVLKWDKPAAMKQGTPVSGKQLNPTANVKGTFTYTVAMGEKMAPGKYPVIASFIPNDTVNYNTGRISSEIEVTNAPRAIVVTFDLSSSKISASLLAQIKANAATPGEKVTVYGYVQAVGSKASDKSLSQARADAVAAQIRKLVPTANVVAIGKGRTTEPLCASALNKCAVVEFSN